MNKYILKNLYDISKTQDLKKIDLKEQLKSAKEDNTFLMQDVKGWIEKVKLEGKERAIWESKFVRLEEEFNKLKSELDWLKGEKKNERKPSRHKQNKRR